MKSQCRLCSDSDTATNLPLPNQLATTATTGGQPEDWQRPQTSCAHKHNKEEIYTNNNHSTGRTKPEVEPMG